MTAPCSTCQGLGVCNPSRQTTIKIPSGTLNGTTLRGPGLGNWARGSPGDLLVNVAVDPDPRFERRGLQLHSRVNVSFLEAILGTRVHVDTADGGQWVYLRPGTQPGQEVRLAGKGLVDPRTGERGSHFCRVDVHIPTSLTDAQLAIMRQLQAIDGMSRQRRISEGVRSWVSKVKSAIQLLLTTGSVRGSRSHLLIEHRFGFRSKARPADGGRHFDASEVDSFYRGMDAYGILEVSREAPRSQIRAAYLRAISQWHPDKWHSCGMAQREEARLRSVALNYAYHCLEDEDRRKRYDQFGASDIESFLSAERELEAEAKRRLDELLTNETKAQEQQAARGGDVKVQLRVPFADVFIGREKTVSYSHLERCGRCNGSGEWRPPAWGMSLPVRIAESLTRPLRAPHCLHCDGTGTVRVDKQCTIKVPPGVIDGVTLRRRGEGDWARGSPGDLLVNVAVDPDPRFERRGLQLHSRVNVSFLEAILGTRVHVDTADGGQWVYLRPGTQPGQEVRLTGKGLMSGTGMGRGDIILTVNVIMPRFGSFSISRFLLGRYAHLTNKSVPK